MSNTHRHKKFKGEPKTRQQKRSVKMRNNVDRSQQNEAGYYEGMPGVTVDEYGNRVFMTFLVTPNATYTTQLLAHPRIIQDAIEKSMNSNKAVSGMIRQAVFRVTLKDKTLTNYLVKFALKIQYKKAAKKEEKRLKKLNVK